MPELNETPGAGNGAAQEPTPAPAGPVADNLTGAQLLAALRTRSNPRAPSAGAEPAVQTQPVPEAPAAATPVAAAPEDTDNSNAAPTPDESATPSVVEADAPSAVPEPAPEATPPPAEPEDGEHGVRALKKRVDTLTAKLRDAERKLEEQQRQEPAAQVQPPSTTLGTDQFGHDPEIAQATAELAKLTNALNWLEENPSGGDLLDEQGAVKASVTEGEARNLKRQFAEQAAEWRTLRAARVRELRAVEAQTRAQNEAMISKTFAWAAQPDSAENKFIRDLERTVPEIRRLPGWKLFAALAVDGYGKLTAPKPAAKPAPQPPRIAPPASAAPPRVNGAERKLAEAEAAYEKSGSGNDLKRVLQLRAEARRAAVPA